MTDLTPTSRSQVKRIPERGHYDFETIASILDAGFLCSVGYVIDGQPYVTPTSYWRTGDHVYWHGSSASRMLHTLETGVNVCLTVAHVDGFVLARSAYHHSINYRSVMLFGKAQTVTNEGAKTEALQGFVERMFPGRWTELRPVTRQELKATTVLRMPIAERLGEDPDRPAKGRRGRLRLAGLGRGSSGPWGPGRTHSRPTTSRDDPEAGILDPPDARGVASVQVTALGATDRWGQCRPPSR